MTQTGDRPTGDPEPAAESERSPWNWLLAVPIILPMLTPLFNRKSPALFGFPAFYWLQLAFVLVGVASTAIVYNMTKRGE